jgi:two-component SAPR family response regulator
MSTEIDPGPTAKQPDFLSRLRILVVEDEYLIGLMLEDKLHHLWCEVVSARRVSEAVRMVNSEHFDGAFLDIHVSGELVYPVAEELHRLRVPFAFITAYRDFAKNDTFAAYPLLPKPVSGLKLEEAVTRFRQQGLQTPHSTPGSSSVLPSAT